MATLPEFSCELAISHQKLSFPRKGFPGFPLGSAQFLFELAGEGAPPATPSLFDQYLTHPPLFLIHGPCAPPHVLLFTFIDQWQHCLVIPASWTFCMGSCLLHGRVYQGVAPRSRPLPVWVSWPRCPTRDPNLFQPIFDPAAIFPYTRAMCSTQHVFLFTFIDQWQHCLGIIMS